MHVFFYPSPYGTMGITEENSAIVAVDFGGEGPRNGAGQAETPLLRRAAAQLAEYFAGERRDFELPLAPAGTPFQKRVWGELLRIPYGEVRSYRQVAQAVGCPKGFRAVGMANNRNPIPVIIPCHRVVGADGRLVGYGGGLAMKQGLLDLEGAGAAGR